MSKLERHCSSQWRPLSYSNAGGGGSTGQVKDDRFTDMKGPSKIPYTGEDQIPKLDTADRPEIDLLDELRRERKEQLAVDALRVISASFVGGETPHAFYRSLTSSVAELVGAERVLFWRVGADRMLTAIPGAHGIDDEFVARLYPVPCDPDGTDLTSQVVYRDLIFRAALNDGNVSTQDRRVLDLLHVRNAISAPWRAGDERLGVVAAYDCIHEDGFSGEDAWVLQVAGLAAGVVWQLQQSEARLTETIERLQRVDSARQLLLRNLSSAVDRATKRFATELHDDALQKLTAAEIRLASLAAAAPESSNGEVAEVQALLEDVEEALRKLLQNVRPPSLESRGGLEKTILDRLAQMRTHSGIDHEIEIALPEDPPYELVTILHRQVAEALTNAERHAEATRVRVEMKTEKGGIYGAVTDNGKGFVVAERDRLPGHLGLLALSERPLLAGGWGKIRSEPGAGTIVEFWVPLPS